MEDVNFKGLGVALVTPFKKDRSIDFHAFEKLIHELMEGGCDYLVVLGTTAETPTLTPKEKAEVSKFVKDTVGGRLPLVIGIGGNNTYGIVDDIQTRDLDGYSAILSVAPFYNKPTQEGLFLHFKTISESSPLPIILYNVPSRTGVNITAETTLRLAEFSPKFCGIKEASGDLKQSEKIIKGAPEGFSLISGNDGDTFNLMKMGAAGVISVLGNAFPRKMKRLVDLCSEGRITEAGECQESLSKIIKYLFEDGNPAGVKAVLHRMGMMENVLRLPLVPVSRHNEENLIAEMQTLLSHASF